MSSSPILKINTNTIIENIKHIKTLNKKSKLLFVVKANAYGVGISNIFQSTVDIVDAYGVARLEEYNELKNLKCKKDIFFLSGFYSQDFNGNIPENAIRVIHCKEMVDDYIKTESNKNKKIYLKFDVGMGRLGFNLKKFIKVIHYFRENGFQNITLFTQIPTGYSSIDKTNMYLKKIRKIYNEESLDFMFSNSPVSLMDNSFKGEYIRSASAIIGFNQNDPNIKLSVSLIAKVISIKKMKKGSLIGYGNNVRLNQTKYISILNIGYADGLGANINKSSYLLIKNHKCPIISINMDYLFVDISPIYKEVKLLDDVVIFGDGGISLKKHSENYSISEDEALTKLSGLRIKKQIIQENNY